MTPCILGLWLRLGQAFVQELLFLWSPPRIEERHALVNLVLRPWTLMQYGEDENQCYKREYRKSAR